MVRFTRCFPHAMGSPPRRGSRGGDVAITSPFFCLADLLCYELQPAIVCYHFASLLIWAVNHRFDVTTAFVIVTYSRIHQTT
jgi:hypothetical protein